MASSGRHTARRIGRRSHRNIPEQKNVLMKFFRPDQDQVSMFRLKEINLCQICLDEFRTELISAQPGCCKCLVHLDCFNELAAPPNSVSTFTCPKCDRQLSGESIRAARRRTFLSTGKLNGEGEDNEMILGSMATKNITSRRATQLKQVCGGEDAVHQRKETLGSSSKSPQSADYTEDPSTVLETGCEGVSESSRGVGSDSLRLTFFTTCHERKLAAERKRASRSGDFLSWLLVVITGRSPKEDVPQEESQDRPTQSVYSQFMSKVYGQCEEQTICRPRPRPHDEQGMPAPLAVERANQLEVFLCER